MPATQDGYEAGTWVAGRLPAQHSPLWACTTCSASLQLVERIRQVDRHTLLMSELSVVCTALPCVGSSRCKTLVLIAFTVSEYPNYRRGETCRQLSGTIHLNVIPHPVARAGMLVQTLITWILMYILLMRRLSCLLYDLRQLNEARSR